MEKQNLSKLVKKEDHMKKGKNQAMSAETSLSNDGLTKGDKKFTDQTATEADKGTGGKIKMKPYAPKFATTSKSDPSNSKLDGEGFLSDKLAKGDKKFTDGTATEKDNKVKQSHIKAQGKGKTMGDGNLQSDLSFKKGGKSQPSNAKLDSEGFLAENSLTYLMSFTTFVNEAYESEAAETEEEAGGAEDDDAKEKDENEGE
jgi:hypothetical protein